MGIFGEILSRVTSFMQSQFAMINTFFLQMQNIGARIAQFVQQKLQEFVSTLTKNPKSKKDYWRVFGLYVSKKFAVISLVVVGVVGYLFINYAYPWADGRIWTANLRLDSAKYQKFSGKARVYDTEGVLVYEGRMENGLAHGEGTQYDSTGTLVYKGSFENGKYKGHGELYNSDGIKIYDGDFENNNYDGEGKLFNNIGKTVYIGHFSVGQRSGTGTEYDPATGLRKYYGEYANDVRNGSGVEYGENGETILYEGAFKDGMYGGEGKLYLNGSLLYSGAFESGKYSGIGNLYDIDANALKYSGEFKNGVYDGEGKLYDVNTSVIIYEGAFSNGKKQGEGTSYDKLGSKTFSGNFRGDSIDYIAYLGEAPDKITDEFGKESYRVETDGKLILTYLSMDASVVFKVDEAKGEYVCEKIVLGVKQEFMGLGAKSSAIERREVMGEPFSSINYSCPNYYRTVFKHLSININKIGSVPCDKYILNNYFIRFYFSEGRTELKCIEICSM